MEESAIRSEARLAGIKEEKARLLEDILEAERQVMMWEKKIQLEKETQAALDPEVGQAEVKAMEKEIHRMTLRFETLKRDQERMIKVRCRLCDCSDAPPVRRAVRTPTLTPPCPAVPHVWCSGDGACDCKARSDSTTIPWPQASQGRVWVWWQSNVARCLRHAAAVHRAAPPPRTP